MSGELTNREIMEKHGIKNKTQVSTWMKWYKENQIHRLDQPIGKQYSYGHGPEWKNEDQKKDMQMEHLKMENEILKKYLELREELKKK